MYKYINQELYIGEMHLLPITKINNWIKPLVIEKTDKRSVKHFRFIRSFNSNFSIAIIKKYHRNNGCLHCALNNMKMHSSYW